LLRKEATQHPNLLKHFAIQPTSDHLIQAAAA
jgi:hypothetical protein